MPSRRFDEADRVARRLRPRGAFIRVTCRHVRDLVTEHRRHLVIVVRDTQQAGEHRDLPARQNEGVDLWSFDDSQFPVQIVITRNDNNLLRIKLEFLT